MKNDYIEVIDNFLEPTYFNNIRHLLESPHFAWFYMGNISSSAKFISINGADYDKLLGFSHNVYCDGTVYNDELCQLLSPFTWKIQDHVGGSDVMRVRCDMTVFTEKNVVHEPHVDILSEPHYSAVFYVSEADGATIIFNEKLKYGKEISESNLTIKKTIQPKPNRVVIFDGSYIHTGTSPSNYPRRIIINTNIKP